MKSSKAPLKTDAEKVMEYMEKLRHPLKEEIEAVRKIFKNSNPKIGERIKWNAPSYFYKEDQVTFNHRNEKCVQIIFHNAAIVNIKSALLEGEYKDRRLVHLYTMKDVKQHKKELEYIMNELVAAMDSKV
jgi:hypothetical protein